MKKIHKGGGMSASDVTFKFKSGNKECAEYFASEADRDLLITYLEFFKDKELVYMDEGDYEGLSDIIAIIKEKPIENGILSITSDEFWWLHRFFRKHKNRTRSFKDVSVDDFAAILEELRAAFYIVLTPQVQVED